MTLSESSFPIHTTSFFGLLMLREDLPRNSATEYWSTTHGEIVKCSLDGVSEYVQRHFSATDHSFWPATPTVGTEVPAAWRLDGYAELRFKGLSSLMTSPLRVRNVYFDEQNAFARVLGHATAPGGGRWWTTGFDDSLGHHITLLFRRRRGVPGSAFRHFVYERMARALVAAGARDLRAYAFLPWSRFMHLTPGVAHDNPTDRRYHGLINLGLEDRAAVDGLLASTQVTDVVAEQHTALTAVHAFSVERSVPVVRIDG
jgi:hypothetical protein